MNGFKRLTGRQLTVLVLVGLLATPVRLLEASTRKGDRLFNDARQEEAKGNYDHALQLAAQAMEQDPSDPAYQLEVRRVRFEAGNAHVEAGRKLRNEGHLDEALAEFEKAYGIDPASDIAAQEIRQTREMIRRNANPSDNPAAAAEREKEQEKLDKEEEKTLTPAELARKREQQRTDALLPVPELKPLNPQPFDLRMTNEPPSVLFETVAKLCGVNVLFDPDYKTQQTIRTQSLDAVGTTCEQALNELSVITKSFWKPLSSNTIFVTLDNATKRRDYTDQVVKVFYLSNVTVPQEMQEIQTVLRTVLDVTKVFPFASQNAVVVRCDADTMALVEKMIAALDKPRPEVIVDVMVMEVNTSHMTNITASFAGTGLTTSAIFAPRPGITTPGIQTAASTTGSTTTTTGTTATTTTPTTTSTGTTTGTPTSTTIPLSQLGHISSADFSLTSLPGAALEAILNDALTKVLQAPQIRATDNQKVTLKIGEKVPTASGSFQPGVAGVGVSPLVNTQFTYLDVGVNMEMLAKIHQNNEVSLHIDLDISQVDSYQNLGGISEPEIGQNKETADVRLKEGEVSLIGGIIQRTDSKTTSGIPGLANIPLLGWLFKGVNTDQERNELVIALIPHIVREPDITASDLAAVASGTQQQIKVQYAPEPLTPAQKAAAATSVTPPPATAPVPALPATAPPATAPPATAPPLTPPRTAPLAGAARISFRPQAAETQLNSTITVTLAGDNINNMAGAAAMLRFDPRILRINNIVAGDLPLRGLPAGRALEPSKNILNDSGMADMSVNRGPAGTISGGGGLFTIVFQAVGRGNTTVSVSSVSLTGPGGLLIGSTPPPPLVVSVK